MDRSLFSFIWKYSRREQFVLLFVTVITFPLLFATLELPKRFPELIIKPEGLFAKLGQMLGFDDIDFESHEFSKRYSVKSPDKKFAYDFCNAQMIDYLLRQGNLIIEVDRDILSLTFRGRLSVEQIRPNIHRMQHIRSLMPNYLFDR